MGVGPEHDRVELTPDEQISWWEITTSDEAKAFDADMRRLIRLDEITSAPSEESAPADDDDDDDDDFVWVGLGIPQCDADAVYAAWWAYMGGNSHAWADLDATLTTLFDLLGEELYGGGVE